MTGRILWNIAVYGDQEVAYYRILPYKHTLLINAPPMVQGGVE